MILSASSFFRARRLVPCALAATLAFTVPMQGDDDARVKQLEAENAALRQRLAQLEQLTGTAPMAAGAAMPAPSNGAPTSPGQPMQTSPVTTSPGAAGAQPSEKAGADIAVLSPFEVSSDRDYGYLKTNAVTATRIGMAIQDIPMYIQVLSSDFIHDTNMNNLTDLLRYTAGASGDNSFVSARPSNSSTPQGSFTMRGFTVNTLLRDGVFSYTDYNLDNVDRVEIVQGPAAVFFGAGYPGGVINIVTKQPEFHHVPTTINYTVGQDKENRVVLDTNANFSDKAAMRVVMGWENAGGQRQFEYTKNFDIAPSVSIIPFSDGKLKLTVGDQWLKSRYAYNNGGWYFPTGWFQAYSNPSAALIAAGNQTTAAGEQARIFTSPGNWGADMRTAAGNPTLPIYTTVSPYGYVTQQNGTRTQLKNFDFHSRGTFDSNDDNIATVKVEISPLAWVDLRYVYTKTASQFDDIEGNTIPNADGNTFNTVSGVNSAGYHNYINNHQFDGVVKMNFWGIKNKLLGGVVYQKVLQQYNSPFPGLNYASTPGATNPIANPNDVYVPKYFQNTVSVPVNQVLHDRKGNILQVNQVYSLWDPTANPAPDVASLYPNYNTTMDGYKTQDNNWYLNDQISLFDNKLNLLGGYRQEIHRDAGQNLTANYPYFAPGPYAYTDQANFPPGVYNYSPSYQETNFDKLTGSSYMVGASYAITKEISVYATTSKTFKLNSGNVGGVDPIDLPNLIQAALTHGNGTYVYRGQTITSVSQGVAQVAATGAEAQLKNEDGKNYEAGVKTSLFNDKVVTTFSIFRGIRNNQKLDDTQAQANANEPFNSSTTLFDPTSIYNNKRNFRWRTTGVQNLVYGGEVEAIITPIRNFQTVLNFSYLPTARTVSDPRYTPAYAAGSVVNAAFYNIYYHSRIENVPETTFNMWNKYTFDSGVARNLSLALGVRSTSQRVYSRSIDWNPLAGGWQMPSYVVLDGGIGYSYELMGYRLNSQLNLQNLTDKTYYEGGVVPSTKFAWQLTNGITF